MIVLTEICIGVWCPHCRQRLLKRISMFELKARQEIEFACGCGAVSGLLAFGYGNLIYLSLWSDCCTEPHEFSFVPDEFQEDVVFGLSCDRDDRLIGYVGTSPEVIQALDLEQLEAEWEEDAT